MVLHFWGVAKVLPGAIPAPHFAGEGMHAVSHNHQTDPKHDPEAWLTSLMLKSTVKNEQPCKKNNNRAFAQGTISGCLPLDCYERLHLTGVWTPSC